MISLNLEANDAEQRVLKDYLEQNVNETLADKINNGVRIEKDGKTLINKKDLKTFLSYACEEARKQAEKGARSACVKSDTVFGWAVHFFEEDSIEGTLYNGDGTEYNPPKPAITKKPGTVISPAPKPEPQMSLFDMMDAKGKKPEPEAEQPIEEPAEQEVGTQDFITESEEEPTEADGSADNEQEEPEDDSDGLIQISETEYVDKNGEIFVVAPESKDTEPGVLYKMFGDLLIAR